MHLEPQASYSLLPSQQQLLLRIQHFATLDSNLLLVTGRKGAGKYTLSSALLEQYGSDLNLAWLSCHSKSTTESLREQLLTQLLPQQTFAADSRLVNCLPVTDSLRWMIVVNQAEFLGNQLLVELWGLVELCNQQPELGRHISIVLFAEPKWAQKIAQEMVAITHSELPLLQVPALSLDERKQLFVDLQSRLNEPSSDVELSERRLSEQEGLPAEVVAMFTGAASSLTSRSSLADESETKPTRKLPIKWLVLMAIGLLPALLILWWAYQEPASNVDAQRRPGPAPEAFKPASELLTPETVKPEPAVAAPKKPAEVMEKRFRPAELPTQIKPDTVTITVAETEYRQHIEIDDAAINAIEQQQAKTESEVAKVAPIAAKVAVKQVEKPVANEATLPKPVASHQPKPAPTPSAWWQQLNNKHYVLQVVLMSSEAGIAKFALQNGLQNDALFRAYPAMRKGKRVYHGVYGDYSSKAQARDAIASLKTKHQKLSPWPKSVAAMQQEAVLLD